MKRMLSLILAVLMLAFVLAACDQNKADPSADKQEEQKQSESQDPKPEETENKQTEPETVEPEKQTSPEEQKEEEKKEEEKPEEKPAEEKKDASEAQPAGESAAALAIASTAESLLGTEFAFGGVGPDSFDNSGFVYYCCKKNGVSVPRLAADMASAGKEVKAEDVKKGDIVVFSNEIGGGADFVGIYVGGGNFVSCNNPDMPTCYQNFNASYWTQRFVSARRVA